jgi:hypothetical protein
MRSYCRLIFGMTKEVQRQRAATSSVRDDFQARDDGDGRFGGRFQRWSVA